jgi:hypothetical protein
VEEGRVRARGVATVGAVNAALDAPALPGEGAETVAGLLVDTLGRPPERGERISFDGALVTVEVVEDNRVRRVVVERQPPGNGGENGSDRGRDDEDSDGRGDRSGSESGDGNGNENGSGERDSDPDRGPGTAG